MRFKNGILFSLYGIILFLFTIYSYSQIDLNLTLSSSELYQSFQKQLILVGYFNRPLSTAIYLILIFFLFAFYYLILRLIKQKKLSASNVFWIIIVSSIILFIAYPAFSHDFFNYMFDARIVTKYHANPYFSKALDYPNDLWIRFMHWTHRTYPYGPVWLLVSLPFSFLGFGKFVLTLLNFKLMFTFFHLGNIYLIYKILQKISPQNALLGVAFYAFNPLIIIESLVSPHNEVMMLSFLLLAIYTLLIKKNYLISVVSLLLSAGIKFITIILLPLFILSPPGRSSLQDKLFRLKLTLLFLIPPLLIQIIFREPYPWYFILFIGLGALLIQSKKTAVLLSGLSLGALLRYAPYLYSGEYNQSIRSIQDLLFLFPVVFILIFFILKSSPHK